MAAFHNHMDYIERVVSTSQPFRRHFVKFSITVNKMLHHSEYAEIN